MQSVFQKTDFLSVIQLVGFHSNNMVSKWLDYNDLPAPTGPPHDLLSRSAANVSPRLTVSSLRQSSTQDGSDEEKKSDVVQLHDVTECLLLNSAYVITCFVQCPCYKYTYTVLFVFITERLATSRDQQIHSLFLCATSFSILVIRFERDCDETITVDSLRFLA